MATETYPSWTLTRLSGGRRIYTGVLRTNNRYKWVVWECCHDHEGSTGKSQALACAVTAQRPADDVRLGEGG